jgi:hypothetical protein
MSAAIDVDDSAPRRQRCKACGVSMSALQARSSRRAPIRPIPRTDWWAFAKRGTGLVVSGYSGPLKEHSVELCRGCRRAARRRRQTMVALRIALLLGLLIFLAYWLSETSSDGRSWPQRQASSDTSQVNAATSVDSSSGAGSFSDAKRSNAPVDDRVIVRELADPQRNPPLRQSIMEAVQTGESQTWQSGTHYGMVVVGSLDDLSGQTCRHYWFTVSGAVHDSTPWTGTACRSAGPDGVWSLNPTAF